MTHTRGCFPTILGTHKVSLLLYVDDAVIFCQKDIGLKNIINSYTDYLDKGDRKFKGNLENRLKI